MTQTAGGPQCTYYKNAGWAWDYDCGLNAWCTEDFSLCNSANCCMHITKTGTPTFDGNGFNYDFSSDCDTTG